MEDWFEGNDLPGQPAGSVVPVLVADIKDTPNEDHKAVAITLIDRRTDNSFFPPSISMNRKKYKEESCAIARGVTPSLLATIVEIFILMSNVIYHLYI